ncbi:regulatory protein cys-3 [Podospora aff. communis PSN243]|uniref:Regulatory protein cys-3 n=1 Tax=Podospora aff. communis PSN243 TaxID=3040156 RepID=A0AAV9GU82_9PEZI|nr:regulatory protein cys-3 [Podospora aff. communis PSN243]
MSYANRRVVNVSQYLRDLNAPEATVEETYITDDDLAKDLALFTNTQFIDFETGQNTDYQAPPVKPDGVRRPSSVEDVVTPTDPLLEDFSSNLDFMSSDFSFGDFGSTYTSPTIPSFPDSLGNLQPIQPNPQTAYPPPVSQHQPGYVPSAPRIGGEKRKAEPISPPNRMLSFEEASRLAAEEDKRKRNTAASARFRIKKKQREQALEKSAKEMTEKVTALEGRISALETENKWLKSLVTEKHGGKDDILKKLLKEFSTQGVKAGRSDDNSKDSDSSSGSSTAADDSDSKRSTKKKD